MSIDEISMQEKWVGSGKEKMPSSIIPLYNHNQEIGIVFQELVGNTSAK